MAGFIPKSTSDEDWKQLDTQKDYAVLIRKGVSANLRLGGEHGLYLEVSKDDSGVKISAVDFESGQLSAVGQLQPDAKMLFGRTSECQIKVMHAIVSRQHLALSFSGDILIVRDLNSTNRTYLLRKNSHFEIEDYLANHPADKAQTGTLDPVYEAFGPTISDFLKSYSNQKG